MAPFDDNRGGYGPIPMTANESKQAGAMLLSDGALAEIAALDAPWRDWGDANPGTVTALCQQRRALLLHVQAMSQQLAAAIAERDAARASDEHTAKVLRAMERDYKQQLDTAREALREADKWIESVVRADARLSAAEIRSVISAALAHPSPAAASAATCATCGGDHALHGPACTPLDASDAAQLAARLRPASLPSNDDEGVKS